MFVITNLFGNFSYVRNKKDSYINFRYSSKYIFQVSGEPNAIKKSISRLKTLVNYMDNVDAGQNN